MKYSKILLCFGALAVPGALPVRTHTPQKVTKPTPAPDAATSIRASSCT
jgi:hypothetical protein